MTRSHAQSFASKLATLAVGEVLYLPDGGETHGPTPLERAVHTAVTRSPRVKGRRFATARGDVICHRQHSHVLRIERTE